MSATLPISMFSLNGGEVSSRYEARFDQNKRQTGLAKCRNWTPLTLGGVRRRDGSIYVATCKVVANRPVKRIMGFRASNDAAYVLELGHQYIRFYRDGLPIFVTGTTPLEVVTPYSDNDLAELYGDAQSIDVKYFFHRSYPTQKLVRLTETTFTLLPVTFDPPATQEEEPTGTDLGGGTLTPGATTGLAVTFTASAGSPFLASDVGRLITSGISQAKIVGITSPTVVTANITDEFPSTAAIAAGNWRLRMSPQTKLDLTSNTKEIGEVVTLTATDAAFRSQDVGKRVAVFGGMLRITAFGTATSVTSIIENTLSDLEITTPVTPGYPRPTRAWSLEVPAWSTTFGYPNCGTFYDNRLWACRKLTIYGSQSGNYENFAKGSADSDAIVRTISDDDIDPIVWIKGLLTLLVGTGSGAFECQASSETKSLTPSDFNVAPISARGSARIPPVVIGGLLHYVQYGQRRLRELVFEFATNKYKSPNVILFAEHLTGSAYITELFYAAEPDSLVYAIRSDGALLALVYQEEESVMGWAPITTQGDYKSGCVIPRPSTGKDWIWNIVSRETGTFVEYFESDKMDPGREWNAIQTDCAVHTTHETAIDLGTGEISHHVLGLDHLEGLTVRVIGNGLLYDDQVVASGQITLSPAIPADSVEVGLDYPSEGLTLEPVIPAELGGPFMSAGWAEIGARIRQTIGLTLNGEALAYRKAADLMDKQVPLQKGKVAISNLGYDPFNRISFEQKLPFPAEILGMAGRLRVGDRWKVDTEADVTPPFVFIGGSAVGDMFRADLVLNTSRVDYVLYDELVKVGWNEISPVDCTVLINAGVFMHASAVDKFAFATGGALPPGSIEPVITNRGTWRGFDGAPGVGGSSGFPNGGGGGGGGTAFDIEYDITIDNTDAFIEAGGGGGGGGGKGGTSKGGDGGKGAGVTAATIGEIGAGNAGDGGDGGTYAVAGEAGEASPSYAGGAGGAAGKAGNLNSNTITWIGGSTPPNVVGVVS